MSPLRIARQARAVGIDLIALTDHNSARNTATFARCCREEGIAAVYGLEITSAEEAHLLCLFPDPAAAEQMGRTAEEHLPDFPNNPDLFGDQVYVDAQEMILGEVEKALISATDLSVEAVTEETSRLGGIVIPCHVDRPSFSLVMQLGFLPDLPFAAVECTRLPCSVETGPYPLITNSDAHEPEQIGSRPTLLESDSCDWDGLLQGLHKHRARQHG
jgi:hypothetical protein